MTEAKERPIIFSAPMVRAILGGRKTQTRRVVKPMKSQEDWLSEATIGKVQRFANSPDSDWWTMAVGEPGPLTSLGGDPGHIGSILCPYGRPGDQLWVQEEFAIIGGAQAAYTADGYVHTPGKNAHTHIAHAMPRWASRILLEVVSVRVERLGEISDDDARAEGYADASAFLAGEWASTKDPASWVWVVEFKRVERGLS